MAIGNGAGEPCAGNRCVLASASPRRRELLERLGLTFDVVVAAIDETPLDDETPAAYVARVALGKADAVARDPGTVIVAADTTIELDGRILGKPSNDGAAAGMLAKLAGRWHEVHTAIALRHDAIDAVDAEHRDVQVTTTRVEMVPFDQRRIHWYVGTGEPLGKAGSYAIQGAGDVLVSRIEGSVSNVVGLPLATLTSMFDQIPGGHPIAG